MHGVDCPCREDAHGKGVLYNEPRAAIEINCVDCHGTIRERATLLTSGPAAGFGVKDGKFDQGKARPLANIRFRDPSGGKVALVQIIRSDSKKKDENGNDIALRAGDIIQNSTDLPGRWRRVKPPTGTRKPNRPHP